MKNSTQPTYADYLHVEAVMKAEAALRPRLGKARDYILRSDGKKVSMPRTVRQVTDLVHALGWRGLTASKEKILLAAVKLLKLAPPTSLAASGAAQIVINYRITAQHARQMAARLKREPIVGVSSPDQFARKLLLDFLANRLAYRQAADYGVDGFSLSKASLPTKEPK